jgi:hypothetical protein
MIRAISRWPLSLSPVLALLLAASACAPRAGAQASGRSVSVSGVDDPFQVAEGLAFTLEQVPAPADVIIRFLLKNTTRDRPFWVNRRPRVATREGREIQLAVMDGRRRKVDEQCTDGLETPRPASDFGILRPGEQLAVDYTFDPTCWSLAPGEPLHVMATFRFLPDRSPPPPPGVAPVAGSASPRDWAQFRVPAGWKDLRPPGGR